MFIIQDNFTNQQLAHYSSVVEDWDWWSEILGETRDGSTVFSKIHVFSTKHEAELAKKHLEKEFLKTIKPAEVNFSILKVKPVRGYKLSV